MPTMASVNKKLARIEADKKQGKDVTDAVIEVSRDYNRAAAAHLGRR